MALDNGAQNRINEDGSGSSYVPVFSCEVGSNNQLTNNYVPDGVYSIMNIVVDSAVFQLAFVVINRKWHPLIQTSNDELYPCANCITAVPVSDWNNGTECRLRDNQLAGLWCSTAAIEPDLSISDVTNLISESLGAIAVGEPIMVSPDGSQYEYPISGDGLNFDVE